MAILSKDTRLFHGFNYEELHPVLKCLNAKTVKYNKDETVCHEGDRAENIGVLIKGRLRLLNYDYYGREDIFYDVTEGEMFGEAAAYSTDNIAPVNIIAVEDSEVILIDYRRICRPCTSACSFHTRLIENMVNVMAEKNIRLNRKLSCIIKRTIREKLLTYLTEESRLKKSRKFDIPFNREQLAGYLSVDRSALSYEMSKMSREGIIRYKKNHFELL